LTFNAEESPEWIVNPQRNKDLEDLYGRDSDVYRIRVLGEFPHSDPNCVFSSEDLEKCTDKKLMYRKKAGTNHFLSKKSSKILRRLSKTIIINKSNKKSFLKLIPKFK
jgi:ribosomal protein L35